MRKENENRILVNRQGLIGSAKVLKTSTERRNEKMRLRLILMGCCDCHIGSMELLHTRGPDDNVMSHNMTSHRPNPTGGGKNEEDGEVKGSGINMRSYLMKESSCYRHGKDC